MDSSSIRASPTTTTGRSFSVLRVAFNMTYLPRSACPPSPAPPGSDAIDPLGVTESGAGSFQTCLRIFRWCGLCFPNDLAVLRGFTGHAVLFESPSYQRCGSSALVPNHPAVPPLLPEKEEMQHLGTGRLVPPRSDRQTRTPLGVETRQALLYRNVTRRHPRFASKTRRGMKCGLRG